MIKLNVRKRCTAFCGCKRVASGEIKHVAAKVKEVTGRQPEAAILVFDNETSESIELDLRGSLKDVLARLDALDTNGQTSEPKAAPGPGRPRLGVVPREVTLLPRHWEWLARQPGGASVALRKLVEEARRTNSDKDRLREARESAYRFMTVMAGNLPGYEEAARALFAGNRLQFYAMIASWPVDVRSHAKRLTALAFRPPDSESSTKTPL
jgi:uncharacterized protein